MRDRLGPNTILGYCTNVHAGPTFESMLANLRTHALAVKARVCPDEPMGVGLWLAAPAAREVLKRGRVRELADWLNGHGLLAFTLNGFPYGDFHQPVVKHAVYEPDWADPARLAYTQDLAVILAGLLPAGEREGSISTLPVAWRAAPHADPGRLAAAARNLQTLAAYLGRLEQDRGVCVHVDLEPEPGCWLDRAEDVVDLFEGHLLVGGDEHVIRRHLRVCHDICHSAVMFEDQADALATYRSAGIRMGKVQVSSAVGLDLDRLTADERRAALGELARFHEPRYLHQTTVRTADGSAALFDDLPAALAAAGDDPRGAWRVHFHVPIFAERLGHVGTTQDQIVAWRQAVQPADGVRHFEVETYAWPVLPAGLHVGTLADGIARELAWLTADRPSAAGGPGSA